MGKAGIIDKSRVSTAKAVQAKTKYCIDRPHLWKKTTCDQHRRPITSPGDIWTARHCCPSPVVVSPVCCYPKITSVAAFEQEFGQLLRRTPEYHGLRMNQLGTVLARRAAIHLGPIKWVADPILVSQNVLRSWLDQYEIPAGTDDIKSMARSHKSIETFLELETWYGSDLRKYVALGFTGRRALEEYLGRNGVRVREAVVRAWHDKCRKYTPDELTDVHPQDVDATEYVARALATEGDLREYSCMIRKWFYHQGLAVPQIVERLRVFFPSQDVTSSVVSHFLQRNPPYKIDHWQQLLQDPFVEYLRDLKDHGFEIPDEDEDRTPEFYYCDQRTAFHQSFFKAKLSEFFCMSANFRAVDLHNVWQYICKPDQPYAAVLPCCECGYVFPYSIFVLDPRRRLHMGALDLGHDGRSSQEGGLAFVCEYCVADDGLCSRACIESLRTKWHQGTIHERLYWESRYPLGGGRGHPLRSKHFSMAALDRSLAALYGRREVAREADCPKRCRYMTEKKSWQIHDELFYKHGYDVQRPEFLTDAGRSRWLRIPESELLECDRVSDTLMRDRQWRIECRKRLLEPSIAESRRQHRFLKARESQTSEACIAGGA